MIDKLTWNILIVEDDDDDYNSLRLLLGGVRGKRVNIDWACCFDQGKRALWNGQYDVILMDDQLGDGRGLDLIREAVARDYPAPILLIASRGSYDLDVEAMRAGAADYLDKSEVTAPLLERTIRYAIERYQSEAERKRLLAEIQREQAQLEAVLQALPVGVWIADEQGRITGKNQMANRLLAGDAPLPENIDEYSQYVAWWTDTGLPVQPEEWPLAQSLLTHENIYNQAIDIQRNDGSQITVLCSSAPIFDTQGHAIGGVVVDQDITTQKALEEALQEQKQLLQSQKKELEIRNQQLQGMFDHAPAVMVLFKAEPPYQVLASNRLYQLLWPEPFRSEGLVGKYLTDFFHETDAEAVVEVFREVTQTGKGKTLYHFPLNGLPNRGRTWWDWDLSPVFEDNQLAAFVLVAVDVTSEVKGRQRLEQELLVRQRFEEALWASENRMRRLIDANILGIFNSDIEGRVTDANHAFLAITGFTRDDLLNGLVDWKTMTPEEYVAADERGMAEARERGACTPYEKEMVRKDGSRVPVMVGYAHFEGSLTESVCFLLDLSEQKQAEEQVRHYAAELERSNRDLQDFAFIASHDLQEPLRKIIAFGGRLGEQYAGAMDEEGLDYLDRMRKAADRMQRMINDLLTYSRVSTQGQPFVLVDLNAQAREVLVDLELSLEQSGGSVKLDPLPQIEADPLQMQHLFQNLIGNALKFRRPEVPPEVSVESCQAEPGWVEIRFTDNGIGFDSSYAERIFQPFQRLHGRSQFDGSGMGLAICRKIVERHGGQIYAEGRPGEGSTFIARMPLRQV